MSEKYYDEVIAPQLAAIAQDCANHEMSFAAVVEYEPGSAASTRMMVDGATVLYHMVSGAIEAQGNVDALIMALYKWTKENGRMGESLMLRMIQLGMDEC